VDTLVKARALGRAEGLRYVYIGNVRGVADAEHTYCPQCGKAVVERDVFTITSLKIQRGQCAYCQASIAGVWG
jgi:pyruvate formate lyase activating enzyme